MNLKTIKIFKLATDSFKREKRETEREREREREDSNYLSLCATGTNDTWRVKRIQALNHFYISQLPFNLYKGKCTWVQEWIWCNYTCLHEMTFCSSWMAIGQKVKTVIEFTIASLTPNVVYMKYFNHESKIQMNHPKPIILSFNYSSSFYFLSFEFNLLSHLKGGHINDAKFICLRCHTAQNTTKNLVTIHLAQNIKAKFTWPKVDSPNLDWLKLIATKLTYLLIYLVHSLIHFSATQSVHQKIFQ